MHLRGAWRSFPTRPLRPGAALVAVVLAVGVSVAVREATDPWVHGGFAFATFFPAILLGALWAGVWGATLAWGLSAAAVLLLGGSWGVEPFPTLSREIARQAGFLFESALVAGMGVALRRLLLEREQREAELRRIALRQRLLIDAMSAIVFRVDANGRFQEPERGWTAFTGRPWIQGGERSWITAIHPDDRLPAREAFNIARAEGQPFRHEMRLWSAAGSDYFWVDVTLVPVRDEHGSATEWMGVARDIHRRREAQRVQDLLLGELDHRVRNLIAVIKAVARQTARGAPDLPEFEEAFLMRLDALAVAHGLLTREHWDGAYLIELARSVLRTFALEAGEDAVRIEGPDVFLKSGTAVALTLALHELATNAAKYGALSVSGGRVDLTWSLDRNERFSLLWRESGGPPVAPPSRRGFGSFLIEEALASERGRKVDLEFLPEGVRCAMSFELAQAEAA